MTGLACKSISFEMLLWGNPQAQINIVICLVRLVCVYHPRRLGDGRSWTQIESIKFYNRRKDEIVQSQISRVNTHKETEMERGTVKLGL